ncbi:acyl-CoA reductase-like NAD-dependent aldehyde dehydrogenase [Tamaricihabitans halophyticus]|uniref:Acyl-CoA reductase-like NAD-dependent aldehyde dehydrogenase n=1 Tax=Tamaricihabitans halophyticus TaxID=1262583 RepID=A0A4R2QJ59_9PSEU|nr:aldehyde dehydrogenase family protein [Tamaricihabitans halophyticus]TCP49413.1 acyl-CoA reductase-like NAD-dependent aldehyde dehydrogenase [Tamaricihabitans halophyticus]
MDAIIPTPRPCWIAGEPEQGESERTVYHPQDGTDVATIAAPGQAQIERALAAAADSRLSECTDDQRAARLDKLAGLITERAEEIAETITTECGKPLRWARAEVDESAAAAHRAAAEARRAPARARPSEEQPEADTQLILRHRMPRGPVLAVTGVTFPFGAAALATAAALAVGAPIVLCPAPHAPLSTLLLGEMLAEADIPAGGFSVLPVTDEETAQLVADARLPVVYSADDERGPWPFAEGSGRKHTLRANGHLVTAAVCGDWPWLRLAAQRIALFGLGQAASTVRQVFVERSIAESFRTELVNAVHQLNRGDPFDPDVEIGPLIDEATAERVTLEIENAVHAGAALLAGGGRDGAQVAPTVLTDVPSSAQLWHGALAGPVLCVRVVDSVDEAFAAINTAAATGGEPTRDRHVGLFTRDTAIALRAPAELAVGTVLIGDVASSGAAGRGVGQPGLLTAIAEFTEERRLVFRTPLAPVDPAG